MFQFVHVITIPRIIPKKSKRELQLKRIFTALFTQEHCFVLPTQESLCNKWKRPSQITLLEKSFGKQSLNLIAFSNSF